MAFQDFDVISERRKNEEKMKMRKKIIIIGISSILLACVVAAAAFVVVKRTGPDSNNKVNAPSAPANAQQVDQYSRLVKMICSSAQYKSKCESTLTEALKKDPRHAKPKDLLLISMVLAEAEINKAFNKTATLKFASEEEKGAYEDCKQLFEDAKEEMGFSITEVGSNDLAKLSEKSSELNNWLSAVISYQQTCIDGFPEGKLKTEFEKLFKESRELISNSLSVVSEVSTFFSAFDGASGFHLPWGKTDAPLAPSRAPGSGIVPAPGPAPGPGSAAPGPSPVYAPGPAPILAPGPGPGPAWVSLPELKGTDEKPTPNVTVAKDGSGNFKTISEALAAIPPTYEGRYAISACEVQF